MIKNSTKMIFGLALFCLTITVYAQTTVSGNVTDDDGEGLVGVNVLVEGTVLGTITDVNGDFSLTVQSAPPFTLVVSYVGYETQRFEITASTGDINVQLVESTILGQEVVVSASRVEESTLKSPVSIERIDILDIQNAPSPDFYSSIKNLNGVDFSTQSLTFKSVNARGFGANGNARFVQLIDGIDNQAPGLNFPVGNAVGISELDLESIELIPGAASALYGPNAIQGILLMKSKSPFDYQGLDVYAKVGVNHVDEEDHPMSMYSDYGVRYAKAFNNKWAFKLNASWIQAQDFIAVDERDQSYEVNFDGTIEDNLNSNRENNRFYDGVNVYGDFSFGLSSGPAVNAALAPFASLYPTGREGLFSPRGFREQDFVDNTTESLKLGGALHYRLSDKVEALAQYNIGVGSSVYTANDRFVLDDFSIWTGKLELRGDNFFVRAYTTQENSGDTYAANTATALINQKYYLPDYLVAFAGARTAGADVNGAHAAARAYADNAQINGLTAEQNIVTPGESRRPYTAGSALFNEEFERLRNLSIADGGAKFLDRSALYHYEGSYNFKNEIDFADVVVGANFRTYALNSEGTLFALDDNGDEISFSEFGGYVQISKNVVDNFRLQGSIRYDKNENFDGQYSPRISGVWEFLNNQNLRASYQRGFRIPTTQDQYISLDVQTRRLIGRNELLANRFNIVNNTVYTTESVNVAQASGDPNDLVVATRAYEDFETEKVGTWEVGYKGLLFDGKLLVDVYYYNSTYQDLNAEIDVTQAVAVSDGARVIRGAAAVPAGWATERGAEHDVSRQGVFLTGVGLDDNGAPIALQRYGYDTNVEGDVNTSGYGLSLEYTFGGGYNLGGNYSYNQLDDLSLREQKINNTSFNAPEHRYNITFGNRKLTDRIGFGLSYRWQDAYFWSSAIGTGIVPDFATLDAQVTFSLPDIGARVKVGGSNILNERYTTSLGNPRIGALYYIQLNFDNLLNNF